MPADAAREDALLATKLLKSRVVRRFLVADLFVAAPLGQSRLSRYAAEECVW